MNQKTKTITDIIRLISQNPNVFKKNKSLNTSNLEYVIFTNVGTLSTNIYLSINSEFINIKGKSISQTISSTDFNSLNSFYDYLIDIIFNYYEPTNNKQLIQLNESIVKTVGELSRNIDMVWLNIFQMIEKTVSTGAELKGIKLGKITEIITELVAIIKIVKENYDESKVNKKEITDAELIYATTVDYVEHLAHKYTRRMIVKKIKENPKILEKFLSLFTNLRFALFKK